MEKGKNALIILLIILIIFGTGYYIYKQVDEFNNPGKLSKAENTNNNQNTNIIDDNSSLAEVKKVCKLKSGDNLSVGASYECTFTDGSVRLFYLLSTNGTTSRLIMNKNYVDSTNVPVKMEWCSNNNTSESCNHDGLDQYINNIQKLWSNVTVSLPTYDELYAINNSEKLPYWLTESLALETGQADDTMAYGYWTATSFSNNSFGNTVGCVQNSELSNDLTYCKPVFIDADKSIGIRPVIEIQNNLLG